MRYSIKIGQQSYAVQIVDLETRPVIVDVDGEKFEVWPEEEDRAQQTIKPQSGSTKGISAIPCPPEPLPQAVVSPKCVTAPIPGVIVAVTIKPGQSVKRGEEICVLEAMKMKNSIRAARDGVIETIDVTVGDQVRHGQTLIEFSN
jgi:biotin carboxyl carrier protein